MTNYEEIRNEFGEIAEILKLYPESLQTKVFDILVSQYLNVDISIIETLGDDNVDTDAVEEKEATKEEREQPKQVKSVKKRTNTKETYQFVKDLNLKSIDGNISFADFVDSKQPKSSIEFNVVAIYYLCKIKSVENITFDHVYTCYKEVNRKVPDRLKQSLFDTSGSRYGYIDIKENNFFIPTRGENLVEYELPRPTKGAK